MSAKIEQQSAAQKKLDFVISDMAVVAVIVVYCYCHFLPFDENNVERKKMVDLVK